MVISGLMPIRFSYTLIRDWFKSAEVRDCPVLEGILPHQKLLLLSDGSMTRDLELLYGSRVEVEVRFKGAGPLTEEAASYLEEKRGEEAMEREVWLTVDGRRLVYAHTLIPLARMESGLREELERFAHEPLGRVLNSNKVFFNKDKLEVGVVRCAQAASDLGVSAETPFIARRYILSNRGASGSWIIKASVTEIFCPEVISSSYTEKLKFSVVHK